MARAVVSVNPGVEKHPTHGELSWNTLDPFDGLSLDSSLWTLSG